MGFEQKQKGDVENIENTEDVVEHAYHAVTLFGWSAAGLGVGLVIAIAGLLILSFFGRRSKLVRRLLRQTRLSFVVMMGAVGTWIAYGMGNPHPESPWYSGIQHLILLVVVGTLGWYLYSLTNIVQDLTKIRIENDPRDARRLTTQAQVFQRVLQAVVIISTIVAALLTFPAARAPLASLIASAGILSVIVGFAAQNSIANMFAGMQLAFTDSIRVGDMVSTMMASKEKFGTIEEITLTYVIIRLFNDRSVLVPSSDFTSRPFENWTLHSAEQLGFIEMVVDWSVPVSRVRRKVYEILLGSDLWDHRRWNVQMTEAIGNSVKLRIVISAANPADRWDLECEVREKVVAWMNLELPWAVPRLRTEPEEVRTFDRDLSQEQIADLAEDLLLISGKDGSSRMMSATVASQSEPAPEAEEASTTNDPVHAARLRASRRKAQKARRRSIFNRQPHDTDELPAHEEPAGVDATAQITDPTLAAAGVRKKRPAADGTRMFSGSPAAEKIWSLHQGPGEEIMRQREETSIMRSLDAHGKGQEVRERGPVEIPVRESIRTNMQDTRMLRRPRDGEVDHGDEGGE